LRIFNNKKKERKKYAKNATSRRTGGRIKTLSSAVRQTIFAALVRDERIVAAALYQLALVEHRYVVAEPARR